MAYSRRNAASSTHPSVHSSVVTLDVSPQFVGDPSEGSVGQPWTASGNESNWSPYRIRRTSYVIATASSPGQGSSTTTAPTTALQTGYRRVTDVDNYCPPTTPQSMLSISSRTAFVTPNDEYTRSRLSIPSENLRRPFPTVPEKNAAAVPSIASPLSDIVSPTSYDADEDYTNPENSNQMWNIYDVDGDVIDGDYDGELHDGNDEEYAPNDSTRTPQRKSSYHEATQSDDDSRRQPEAEMLAQRILRAVSSNHVGCGSGQNDIGGHVSVSHTDGFWFTCNQNDTLKTVKSAGHLAGTGRETEMILFPIEKDDLRAAYTGEADISIATVGFGGGSGVVGDGSAVKTSAARADVTAGTTRSLVVISLSFVLVFSSFRSVQSLESSLNASGGLGVIAMSCAHASMCLTCHVTPRLVERLSSKWTMVLGIVLYMAWIAANMAPHPLTLLPTALGVGFGQSLVWSAQVVYVRALREQFRLTSSPSSSVRRKPSPWSALRRKCRYDGLLLAGFQTSHVWGNLVSSILLASGASSGHQMPSTVDIGGDGELGGENIEPTEYRPQNEIVGLAVAGFCGVYDRCAPGAGDAFGSLANGTGAGQSVAVSRLETRDASIEGRPTRHSDPKTEGVDYDGRRYD